MKIVSEAVRILLFFFIVSTITTQLDKVTRSVSSVNYIQFDLDERLSSNTKEEIQSYVKMLRANGRYNTAALVDHLPARFSCIESAQAQSLPNHSAKLVVKTYDPLVTISHNAVLTLQGHIVERHVFDSKLLSALDSVSIPSDIPQEAIPALIAIIHQAQQTNLIKSYDITWINEHNIRLQHKKDPDVTIVCSHETLPDDTMQNRCIRLIKDKPHARWKADIRFDDQIIISMDKGGQDGTYA